MCVPKPYLAFPDMKRNGWTLNVDGERFSNCVVLLTLGSYQLSKTYISLGMGWGTVAEVKAPRAFFNFL